jgi:hypothetical protein
MTPDRPMRVLREQWLAAVNEHLARRYGVSLSDVSFTRAMLAGRFESGESPEAFIADLAGRHRLKPLPEDGSQDRSASDGGSEDGEAARSDLNQKTSVPKGMPRD